MFRKLTIFLFIILLCCVLFLRYANFNTNEVIIAVIDTGIKEEMHNNENILNGFDFVDYDDIPNDETGHGTLMTEIITDLAPNSYIIPVKFIDKKESYTLTRPFAILYAIFKGADVINMSFNGDSDIITKWVIAYGNSKGVIFVGSSGNRGVSEVDYPAKYRQVLAVGGIDPSNDTYYGNYGEDINFVAPSTYTSRNNNQCMVGTSISSAYISGVIAYTKYNFPELNNEELKKFLWDNSRSVEVMDGYSYPLIDIKKIKAIKDNDLYFCMKNPLIHYCNEVIKLPMDSYNVNEIDIYDNGRLLKKVDPADKQMTMQLTAGEHSILIIARGKNKVIEKDYRIFILRK